MSVNTCLRVRIEARLEELEVTKAALCRRIDRPQRWLSDILAGRHGLTRRAIRQLAEALGVPFSFLVGCPRERLGDSADG